MINFLIIYDFLTKKEANWKGKNGIYEKNYDKQLI